MGYANIQADVNFYRQSLNADGVKYVTGPYTSLYEDVFRAVTVTTDSVVSVTSYVGDSLSNQFLLAGTEIYGLFSSVTIHSGKAVLHLAGASYISEIINQYSATGIPLGFYEEGTQCLSQKISSLLTQGLFDDASWVMIPSQYEEDWVRAFKPTSELGNLAFTRSSDATFTDSTGVVRRSPWNLVQYSELLDNTNGWSILGTRFTSSKVTGPTGTNNAYLLTEVAATDSHNVFTVTGNRPNSEAGRTYTVSAYFKAGTRRYCGIAVGIAGSGVHVFVDTTNWTITDAKRFSTNTNWVYLSSAVQADLNGFYRVSLTFRTDAALSMSTSIFASNVSTSTSGEPSYLGDGSTIISTGAQLVEGNEALPYFATTDRLNVPRLDYRNADGTLSTCPRLLLEPQRTNSIRNSSMVGAVAGSPGTAPTNWAVSNLTGLTQTVVGTGVENGLPYIDIRYNGTGNGSTATIFFEGAAQIVAANGETWTHSIYFKTVSGTLPSLTRQYIRENTSGGVALVEGFTSVTITSDLKRFNFTRTLNGGATVARVQPYFLFIAVNGQTYDFTIRIAAPQMELGAYATTWVPTTTTAVTRIGDAFTRNNIYTNGFISAAGGTWFVDFTNNFLYSPTNEIVSAGLEIGDSAGNSSNAFKFRRGGGLQRINLWKRVSSVDNIIYSPSVDVAKYAIKWNGTTADVFFNGVKVVSATSFTATNMQFLRYIVDQFPMYMNQSFLAPTPLSDAECIALTTL